MSNILPGSKPQVDPKLEDLAFITQDNKPRNSTLQKIKNLFLGTTNMGTTSTTVTGAVAEVNSKLNDLTNNKADKSILNLKTYINLSQLGITETTALLNVIQKLPLNSMIMWDYKSTITCSDTAPDGNGYGTMIIIKYSTTRIILFYQSKDGFLYNTTANLANSVTEYINSWDILNTSDSGFLDLPLANGVSNYASYDTAKYRKSNKTVKLTGRVTGLTGTNGTIGTLPSGFRPIQNSMFTTLTNGVKLLNVMVGSNGVIEFNAKEPIEDGNFITLDGIIFDI